MICSHTTQKGKFHLIKDMFKQLYKGPITTTKRDTSPCLDHFLHCPYSNILVPPFPFPSKFTIDILIST